MDELGGKQSYLAMMLTSFLRLNLCSKIFFFSEWNRRCAYVWNENARLKNVLSELMKSVAAAHGYILKTFSIALIPD